MTHLPLTSSVYFSTAMQIVIQAYMKHLGVKVKESRGFEPKPKLINLLPKIKVRPPPPVHTCFAPCARFKKKK